MTWFGQGNIVTVPNSQVRSDSFQKGRWALNFPHDNSFQELTNPLGHKWATRKQNCLEKTMWRDTNSGAACISMVWGDENAADFYESNKIEKGLASTRQQRGCEVRPGLALWEREERKERQLVESEPVNLLPLWLWDENKHLMVPKE